MTILQKLINAMLQRIEVVPVPQQELDDFLAQNQIRLCPEHYRFILDYGNSPFLINWFANLSFDEFKDYYSDKELLPDSVLPANCDFIGLDFSDDTFSMVVCRNYCFTVCLGALAFLNVLIMYNAIRLQAVIFGLQT